MFAVKVNNVGNTTVIVDRCDTNITFNYLLAGPDNLPDAFDYNVTLADTEEALKVKPGETVTIPFTFLWNMPSHAPPMVAICRASFTLRYDATSGVENFLTLWLPNHCSTNWTVFKGKNRLMCSN